VEIEMHPLKKIYDDIDDHIYDVLWLWDEENTPDPRDREVLSVLHTKLLDVYDFLLEELDNNE
tara:strand:- start:1453 stop:1641 length:189 start_codon:yes stop_codon:yes gene_type:complete